MSATPSSLPHSKPELCLALDGLLAELTPAGRHGRIGPIRPGAREFTRRLAKDYRVIIYTHRVHWDLDLDRPTEKQLDAACRPVFDWLNENKVWFDGVFVGQGKPDADLFIGPRDLCTPFNPTHDDFCEIETTIRERVKP